MLHRHRASIWLAFGLALASSALILMDVDAWALLVDDGKAAVRVSLLGTDVGEARDREYLDLLLELLLPSVGTGTDETAGWVTTSGTRLQGNVFRMHAALRSSLQRLLTTHEAGFAVSVNGEPVVTVPTAGEAADVVTGLIARFTPKAVQGETIRDLEVATAERLTVEPALTPRAAVMSGADALAYLLAGTRERRTYRVVSGDTLWQIASRHGMSVEEILKANPGVAAERIFPGQTLSLIVPRPLVNVDARYVRVFRRVIPFPVSVTWNPSMYRTERRVDRPGSVGQKEITERVTRRNGEVTEEAVLKEVVLRWPQTQFLTAGTRRTPEDVLGDRLADGEVAQMSSEFGLRWRRMHGGVDWAMPTGTPVRAWRDGTVKVAQAMFGYGRLVILEHGDDYMTYYAHLSRFNVRVGQTVGAGEVIAWSGNTGNSTGPHLHFEVHHKGAHVDPIAVLGAENAAIGGP